MEIGLWRWVCGGGFVEVEVGVWRWVCGDE